MSGPSSASSSSAPVQIHLLYCERGTNFSTANAPSYWNCTVVLYCEMSGPSSASSSSVPVQIHPPFVLRTRPSTGTVLRSCTVRCRARARRQAARQCTCCTMKMCRYENMPEYCGFVRETPPVLKFVLWAGLRGKYEPAELQDRAVWPPPPLFCGVG
eukprot:3936261-Rhodomonas_salina.1